MKNITTYIVYKFALEWYNGAFITLANERFGENRYYNIGILTGVNYAMQCFGTIIVAPLIKKYPIRSVLSIAVLVFGVISAILLVVDASTGGVMKFKTGDQTAKYGCESLFSCTASLLILVLTIIPSLIFNDLINIHSLRQHGIPIL
ncbi:hypothetical protein PM082_021421 [Marasmius tenuissimus]|nr:hypothetical protein PM082_021421 [Marasmius tenuissimus]